MSVSGISASSYLSQSLQSWQTKAQTIQNEFQQLGQDLQSGNLTQAQSDFKTLSQNLPVTAGAVNATSMGANIDGFMAVLDPARALTYGSYITGPGYQIAYGIAADASGNAYVAGLTTSDVFLHGGAIRTDDAGNIDVFFMAVATGDTPSASALKGRARIDVFGEGAAADRHRIPARR